MLSKHYESSQFARYTTQRNFKIRRGIYKKTNIVEKACRRLYAKRIYLPAKSTSEGMCSQLRTGVKVEYYNTITNEEVNGDSLAKKTI